MAGVVKQGMRISRQKGEKGNITWASFNLSEQDLDEYYNQFSNAVLWPAFHYRLDLVQFQRPAWDGYLRVNALLADKLLPLLQDDDIIWITIITCCHLRMNYANGE